MANISVTNALNNNAATSDITLVGTNFSDLVNGLTDGTKDISISAGTFAGTITGAGVISMANGSVSAPPYSFTSDLNTGIYRIGSDNLGIATGGVKRIDIDSGGIMIQEAAGSVGADSGLIAMFSPAYNGFMRAGFININCGADADRIALFLTDGTDTNTYIWIDNTGAPRWKTSAPTSNTDGTAM